MEDDVWRNERETYLVKGAFSQTSGEMERSCGCASLASSVDCTTIILGLCTLAYLCSDSKFLCVRLSLCRVRSTLLSV